MPEIVTKNDEDRLDGTTETEGAVGGPGPITRAVIRTGPRGLERVAGMSVVARQVCAAQKSVTRIRVEVTPDLIEAVRESLLHAGCDLETVQVTASLDTEKRQRTASPKAHTAPVENDSRTGRHVGAWELLITGAVVLDPVFLSDLFERIRNHQVSLPLQVGSALWIRPVDTAPVQEKVKVWDPAAFAGTFVELDHSIASARRAKRALIRACRKPLDIDGLICLLLGRRLSGLLSYGLVELPIRPNAVTAVSLLIGLTAAAVAAFGGYHAFAWGGGLLFFSWVLDNCDGEIARVKYQGSRWGAWFDIYADFVTNVAFVGAMAIGFYRVSGSVVYLVAGLYTLIALTLYNGVVFRFIHKLGVPDEFLFQWWFDRKSGDTTNDAAGHENRELDVSWLSRSFSYIKYLGRRDFFIFAYFVTALLGILEWAFWATAGGSTYSLVLTVIHLAKTGNRVDPRSAER
jgi:hypothetical protein